MFGCMNWGFELAIWNLEACIRCPCIRVGNRRKFQAHSPRVSGWPLTIWSLSPCISLELALTCLCLIQKAHKTSSLARDLATRRVSTASLSSLSLLPEYPPPSPFLSSSPCFVVSLAEDCLEPRIKGQMAAGLVEAPLPPRSSANAHGGEEQGVLLLSSSSLVTHCGHQGAPPPPM